MYSGFELFFGYRTVIYILAVRIPAPFSTPFRSDTASPTSFCSVLYVGNSASVSASFKEQDSEKLQQQFRSVRIAK